MPFDCQIKLLEALQAFYLCDFPCAVYSTELIMWKSLSSNDKDSAEMNHDSQNIIYTLYNCVVYFAAFMSLAMSFPLEDTEE